MIYRATDLPTNLFHLLREEDSVPVRAPPTEAPEVEFDEYSGHMTPTEANEEMLMRGQNESMYFVNLLYVSHNILVIN